MEELLNELEELNKLNDYCYLRENQGGFEHFVVVNIIEEHDDLLYDVFNDERIQNIVKHLDKLGIVYWYKNVLDNCMGVAFIPGEKLLPKVLERLEYDY
nr:MAG TPA: hypothetical protein [Caudoviricetes sp.]